MKWFLLSWIRAGDFQGRSRRTEYWMFNLINCVVVFGSSLIIEWMASESATRTLLTIPIAYVVISTVPSLSCTVRRLHDVDKSGWWYFISLVPLIGGVYLLVLMCTDGDSGTNRFGTSPK